VAGKIASAAVRLGAGLLALTVFVAETPARAQGIAGPYLAAEDAARRGDLAMAAQLYAEVVARDPDNPVLLERAVIHQVAAGEFAQAVALARRLEQLQPGQHIATLVLATEALRRGDLERVETLLAPQGDESGPYVNGIIRAWAAFGRGEFDQARRMLSESESSGGGGPAGKLMSAYHLGLFEAARGDDGAAVEALARAAERAGTGTLRLARIRAGALARLDRLDEAQAVIAESFRRVLSDPRLEQLAGDLAEGRRPAPLVRSAKAGAAEALYGISGFLSRGPNRLIGLAYVRLATFLKPDLIEAQLLLANHLHREEQYDLAIEAYDAVPDDSFEALDAEIGRAEALEDAGKIDAAVAALGEVVRRWPESIDAHTALGNVLRRAERFAEAALAYDNALALIGEPETRHWPLYYQRGISYERSKQWDKAERDFKTALELEPDQPLVLNYLGYSWVEMGRNLEEAKAMIERAVEQRSDDGYIVDSLGWVLFRMGQFKAAVEHLERAVELKPVDPVINDHFGDALWMVGRRVEARFQWRRALSFDPKEADAERIRRKLEIGLDRVLAEEAAAGKPAIVGQATEEDAEGNDGG